MNRRIVVKGIGKVSVRPDLIQLLMTVQSQRYDYESTMKQATDSISQLQKAMESAGFDKTDLKTTQFDIQTDYESYRDKQNNYKRKFAGYVCEQRIKLEFDLNMDKLSAVLTAVSKAGVDPHLMIHFSVKDKEAVNESLLIKASENAKQKADILTKASGVNLGQLVSIDYDWGELHLYSQTKYVMEERMYEMDASATPDIEPDDIDVSDTVSFVWEIN